MAPSSLGKVTKSTSGANLRLIIWFGVLFAIVLIFIARLFYLQVVKHDYYRALALAGQQRQYSIAAPRGIIQAYSSGHLVPLVLNQTLYTLYADPVLIKNPELTAQKINSVVPGSDVQYINELKTKDTRYVVLARRLTEQQKTIVTNLKLSGVGAQAINYRVYPQGSLASQLLGFVNTEGKGNYGIEQYMDSELSGTPGLLKAITDASGIPLAASKDNVRIDPKPGDNLVLTIDLAMQKQLETILRQGLQNANSGSGSAVIMDPYSGEVKAIANWPTYDPANYFKVRDTSVFNNAAVSSPLEVGSSMKTLTAAAALDKGVINKNTYYNDPAKWKLDGHYITNIEEDGGPGRHNIADILNLSINTGATWMLMQMGGGQINSKARNTWYDYMVNHYQLGKPTGIEQGYEASGYIPSPDKGFGLDLTYANTAFGQALTATPLQMAAAVSSIVNGGTYYKPHLIEQVIKSDGSTSQTGAEVVRRGVVSTKVSSDIRELMEFVVKNHKFNPPFNNNYRVGGKTGTAQIANPAGGYYENKFNGTYVGFVGGDQPQYVIVVRVNEPHIHGYAGAGAAMPIFGSLAHMLIDNFNVTPVVSH